MTQSCANKLNPLHIHLEKQNITEMLIGSTDYENTMSICHKKSIVQKVTLLGTLCHHKQWGS